MAVGAREHLDAGTYIAHGKLLLYVLSDADDGVICENAVTGAIQKVHRDDLERWDVIVPMTEEEFANRHTKAVA